MPSIHQVPQRATYPPAPAAPPLIDTLRILETPEGVELVLHPAGPVPRALALTIDLFVRGLLYLALSPLLVLGGLGLGLALLGAFLLEWFYPVVFEVSRGATPGKQALGLQVVHEDGTPVGWSASLLRNLLRVVDWLPVFYGIGLVSMLCDRHFRRLGDLAAGTLVIHAEVAATPGLPARAPEAPPRTLDLPTQQAVLAFAERHARLSDQRQAELAEVLVGRQGRGTVAVEQLLGWASWIAGGSAGVTPSAGADSGANAAAAGQRQLGQRRSG